jgi:hypothetical protein
MPRKKKLVVEIERLPEAALVPNPSAAHLQAEFDRMVRQRVDEILAERRPDQMAPAFQPREVAYELQRRQSVFQRREGRLYFEKWGCMICQRKKHVSHASGGICSGCYGRETLRRAQIRREYERSNPEAEIDKQIDRLTSRLRSAQELLGEIEK